MFGYLVGLQDVYTGRRHDRLKNPTGCPNIYAGGSSKGVGGTARNAATSKIPSDRATPQPCNLQSRWRHELVFLYSTSAGPRDSGSETSRPTLTMLTGLLASTSHNMIYSFRNRTLTDSPVTRPEVPAVPGGTCRLPWVGTRADRRPAELPDSADRPVVRRRAERTSANAVRASDRGRIMPPWAPVGLPGGRVPTLHTARYEQDNDMGKHSTPKSDCSACNGKGKVVVTADGGESGAGQETKDCTVCNGTGKV